MVEQLRSSLLNYAPPCPKILEHTGGVAFSTGHSAFSAEADEPVKALKLIGAARWLPATQRK
eukprot:7956190-Alexandrium_andersonii.AAC.1